MIGPFALWSPGSLPGPSRSTSDSSSYRAQTVQFKFNHRKSLYDKQKNRRSVIWPLSLRLCDANTVLQLKSVCVASNFIAAIQLVKYKSSVSHFLLPHLHVAETVV